MHAFFLAHYLIAEEEDDIDCDIVFNSYIDNEPIVFESEICHCEESS